VFDASRAAAHVNVLAGDIGSRAAGTANEQRGAEYIRDQLTSYGYSVELQPFSISGLAGAAATLAANGSDVTAAAMNGSPQGRVQAHLVSAGLGYPQDFPAAASGSVVLVQRGEIFFSEKVANAQAAGAVGVIIYNNEAGGFSGAVEDAGIPAVTISREDGQALVSSLSAGAVNVALAVEVDESAAQSRNVIAKPPTGTCRVIVGGHLDSVLAGPGANDNGSGTAVTIELARAMAADGQFGDVCFVLFGAEEIGLIGSIHYLDSLPAMERDGIEAMLNFDMLAVGDAWPLGGTTSLVNLAGEVMEKIGIPYTIQSLPEGVGSDHAPFQNAGIPAIIVNCFCDPNYHTAQDLPQFVKQERLGQAGALGMGMVERLLASPPQN
jgi:aminopeptidase YwaD